MDELLLSVLFIAVTIIIYIAARKFYLKFSYPFTIPLLMGTVLLIIFLLIFQIPYETYELGGKWFEMLLGPAVVALAYPLYKQIHMLKKYFVPIIVGVVTGAIIGIVSGFALAKWFGLEDELIYSIWPKSVTTPVAMEIARSLGGAPPLAAIFVIIAGLTGVVLGPFLYRWFKINHFLGKGIGMGSASHAIGTSSALDRSEEEGAASSVAMTLSAIIVSVITPILVIVLN